MAARQKRQGTEETVFERHFTAGPISPFHNVENAVPDHLPERLQTKELKFDSHAGIGVCIT
jgi:hypothetical protein